MEPQSVPLFRGQLEHEVVGEPILIAGNGLVEVLGFNAVKAGQVGIEHDALPADHIDLRGDAFNRNDALGLRLGHPTLCPARPAQVNWPPVRPT